MSSFFLCKIYLVSQIHENYISISGRTLRL
nr:MAG TPA: envelope glycoprotein [Caudoviricetes sp.]